MPRPYRSINCVRNKFLCGDTLAVLRRLPSESVDSVVTSPPYWALRDYKIDGQIGLEPDFKDYLDKLLEVFREVRRVLKPQGTCWVNLGDTYASSVKGRRRGNRGESGFVGVSETRRYAALKTKMTLPSKTLCLVPSRFAIAMLDAGWVLRNEIIWHKTNAMPQSVKDRFTVDYERIFFFVKSRTYSFEQQFEPVRCRDRLERPLYNSNHPHKFDHSDPFVSAINPMTYDASRKRILERGRNMRSVWSIPTMAYHGGHFASFTPKLIETPIRAGCPPAGIVLDPFMGSGTTALTARKLGRNFIGIDINPQYVALARERLAKFR